MVEIYQHIGKYSGVSYKLKYCDDAIKTFHGMDELNDYLRTKIKK